MWLCKLIDGRSPFCNRNCKCKILLFDWKVSPFEDNVDFISEAPPPLHCAWRVVFFPLTLRLMYWLIGSAGDGVDDIHRASDRIICSLWDRAYL